MKLSVPARIWERSEGHVVPSATVRSGNGMTNKNRPAKPMADATIELLKSHFRQLRLPSMSREFERLARDAAASNSGYFEFLLHSNESAKSSQKSNKLPNSSTKGTFSSGVKRSDFRQASRCCSGAMRFRYRPEHRRFAWLALHTLNNE